MYRGVDPQPQPSSGEVMWEKVASILGSGTGEVIDSIKKIAIDSWHISPEKAAQLDAEKVRVANELQMKVMSEVSHIIELENADRASARTRESTVKDLTPMIMAGVMVAGFFSVVWYMLLYVIPVENQRILDMMLGSLMGSVTSIVAYYFGSSSSSAAKQALIEKIAGK